VKAIRFAETGGPEVLRLEDVPLPEPGQGEARIKIEAIGVNFIDIYQRTGQYNVTLPATPGSEASGVVEALGPQEDSLFAPRAEDIDVGSRVASAQVPGAYAQYAIVPAHQLVALPDEIDFRTAAAVMLQGMTAHYLVRSAFPLDSGYYCLIHAASGGVGHLLVQAAKRFDARVIATVGSEEKAELARRVGADHVINYTRQDFVKEVGEYTHGRGCMVVFDSVGKDTFLRSLDCLTRRGTMILYGQSSGAVPPFDPQILNAKGSLWLTRPTLGDYITDRPTLQWRAGDLFEWIAAGELEVRIDQAFPLEEAGAAQQHLSDRKSTGKVLLIPPP
jgi:NADPH2:quinone reductase